MADRDMLLERIGARIRKAQAGILEADRDLEGAKADLQALKTLPDAPEPSEPPARPLEGVKVCVDPGHGGADPGAVAPSDRTTEKDIVLHQSLALSEALKAYGATVKLTRVGDIFVPLGERARISNAFNADCFISVHANAADSKLANGAWVIHDDKTSSGPRGGIALARHVFREMAKIPGVADLDPEEEVFPDASPWVGGRNLAVVSQTRAPAILVELGFLTNEEDLSALKSTTVRKFLAEAIAMGVIRWSNGELHA